MGNSDFRFYFSLPISLFYYAFLFPFSPPYLPGSPVIKGPNFREKSSVGQQVGSKMPMKTTIPVVPKIPGDPGILSGLTGKVLARKKGVVLCREGGKTS
jgi:hypothetical protein